LWENDRKLLDELKITGASVRPVYVKVKKNFRYNMYFTATTLQRCTALLQVVIPPSLLGRYVFVTLKRGNDSIIAKTKTRCISVWARYIHRAQLISALCIWYNPLSGTAESIILGGFFFPTIRYGLVLISLSCHVAGGVGPLQKYNACKRSCFQLPIVSVRDAKLPCNSANAPSGPRGQLFTNNTMTQRGGSRKSTVITATICLLF